MRSSREMISHSQARHKRTDGVGFMLYKLAIESIFTSHEGENSFV